jgi:hypothetical protein
VYVGWHSFAEKGIQFCRHLQRMGSSRFRFLRAQLQRRNSSPFSELIS